MCLGRRPEGIREIVRLIILEASERGGRDLVGKIATVNVEVMLEMMEILMAIRESERNELSKH